jgi:BirA family biotin operon repressor/biotin-[acetyl-CoA-carboxylase] ligase
MPLDHDQIDALLKTRRLGRARRIFDVIDSTSTALLALPEAEAADGLAYVAEHQTAGRGRLQRRWEAPPGRALLVSFILRGEAFARVGAGLTMAVVVGARRALERFGAGTCRIRWPNDLLLAGKKVCGILTETGPWRDEPGWVVGIGVNVNQTLEDFPPELRDTATSMAIEAGAPLEREAVLAALLTEIEAVLDALVESDAEREAIRSEWENASSLLGQMVAIDTGVEIVEGMAAGLEIDGGLIVRQESGRLRTVTAGTVLKGRPS